jgi:hypothetical protein
LYCLSFFFWPLYCLSFFFWPFLDLRILITPLVSSNYEDLSDTISCLLRLLYSIFLCQYILRAATFVWNVLLVNTIIHTHKKNSIGVHMSQCCWSDGGLSWFLWRVWGYQRSNQNP